MNQFRGFIAIDIPASPKIIEFEESIKKSGANVKLVDPKNIHITLKFLGDTNEELIDNIEKIIKNSIQETKPFTIQLTGTGVFPNPNYIKVIWIGIKKAEELEPITKNIDEQLSQLGFKKESRVFSPHLTIGRVRNAKNKQELINAIEKYTDTEFTSIKVDSIKLKQSTLTPNGPIYKTLRNVKI